MKVKERIFQVQQIFVRKGCRSVTGLFEDLGISKMTVRRYLDAIEQNGLARRTHGGAVALNGPPEIGDAARATGHGKEKEAIGRLAWDLVGPGEAVHIDAGSTAACMALFIGDSRRITVVTGSLPVAEALGKRESVRTILTGGRVHGSLHGMMGPLALEAVRQFRFTKAFLGTAGIDLTEGFTESDVEQIAVKRLVAANSREVIVLITDGRIGSTQRAAIERRGVRVLVAR